MSQRDFREIFLNNVTNFLWGQWSALGVQGEARFENPWVIDPEALLVFTVEIARYEPRLFDEVMDWLVTNGKWIDNRRLRGILRKSGSEQRRLVGAVSEFLASQGQERKWQNLSKVYFKNIPDENENLFKSKLPLANEVLTLLKSDNSFNKYAFKRNLLHPSKKSREVLPNAQTTLRFMLRALFGIGSRAECILYLLTHDGGHPSEISDAIGLSIRGTQDALIELSKSNLVLTRVKGKRKIEYWISQERWWEFFTRGNYEEINKPAWIDWIALYGALSDVWETLEDLQSTTSEYMKSSKLRDAMEVVGNELARSGIDIPPIPGRDVRPEVYQRAFENFIIKVFGAEEVEA